MLIVIVAVGIIGSITARLLFQGSDIFVGETNRQGFISEVRSSFWRVFRETHGQKSKEEYTFSSSNNLYKYISSLKSDLSIDEKIFKQLTISYLNYLPKLSKIIIGSVSPVHLKFFMDSLNKSIDKNTLDIINERAYSQKEWTNPRNW